MFNSISGEITGHEFPFVYLSTNGIEWSIEVSAATFQSVLAAESGVIHRLYTYLYSREDVLKLYGFWSIPERRAFLELVSVSGIGPRQALKVLSGTTPEELARSLEEEDVTMLTRIPGLGKKTAQRLILQLKGHLVTIGSEGSETPHSAPSLRKELVEALSEMGYDAKAAATAIDEAAKDLELDPLHLDPVREQELFRSAIVRLSGS